MENNISLPDEFMVIRFLRAEDFYRMTFNGQIYEIIGQDDVGNFVGIAADKRVFLLDPEEKRETYISKSLEAFSEEIKAYHEYCETLSPDDPSDDELAKLEQGLREIMTGIDENACADEASYWSCVAEELGYGI